jgi:hypothetical protein
MMRQVPRQQRGQVATTLAFASALAGKPWSDGIAGVDSVLLKHLAAVRRGELPAFPDLAQGLAPTLAIYSHVAQAHAQAAWNTGNADELRRSLGALTLLCPTHPEAKTMHAVLAAVNPQCGKNTLLGALNALGDGRIAWARRLAALVPARATMLLDTIPIDQRTAGENEHLWSETSNSESLPQLVTRTLTMPSTASLVTTFIRCVKEGRLDLATALLNKAPADLQPELRLALAYQTGDLVTAAKLDPKRNDLLPGVSIPVSQSGTIAFHLATASGLIPAGELTVLIDGAPMGSTRIKRLGSLVVVDFRSGGVVTLEVRLSGVSLFSGKVST